MSKSFASLVAVGAATLLVLGAAPTAQATVSGSLKLSNFSFELVDLDLNDGFSPSASFAGDQSFWGHAKMDGQQVEQDVALSVLKGPVTLQASDAFGQALSAVDGDALTAGCSVAATDITLRSCSAYALLSSGGPAFAFEGVRLGPNTRLLLIADVSYDVRRTSFDESGTVSVDLFTWLTGDAMRTRVLSRGAGVGTISPMERSGSVTLKGSFDNLSAVERTGGYYWSLFNDNYSRVTSVPEPATWMVMAMGLAGLALWRRRT